LAITSPEASDDVVVIGRIDTAPEGVQEIREVVLFEPLIQGQFADAVRVESEGDVLAVAAPVCLVHNGLSKQQT
jgi:hypothetical protein